MIFTLILVTLALMGSSAEAQASSAATDSDPASGLVNVFGAPSQMVRVDDNEQLAQLPFTMTLPEGMHRFAVQYDDGRELAFERHIQFPVTGQPITVVLYDGPRATVRITENEAAAK